MAVDRFEDQIVEVFKLFEHFARGATSVVEGPLLRSRFGDATAIVDRKRDRDSSAGNSSCEVRSSSPSDHSDAALAGVAIIGRHRLRFVASFEQMVRQLVGEFGELCKPQAGSGLVEFRSHNRQAVYR